jgi:polysaccharide biosynthesis protein PslH
MLRGLPPWATDCRDAGYASMLERVLETWHPDIVEIHLQAMAQYVAAPARLNIATILVDHDPPSAWARDLLRTTVGPRRIARRLEAALWERYEGKTRRHFDAIVAFTERDAAAIGPTARPGSVVRIPLSVEVPARPLDPRGSDPPTILFVGAFSHPPNVDAALWLALEIFPRVRARMPDVRLALVGDKAGDEIRALADGSVSVHSSVSDLDPYLERAAVVVAPVRMGGGMRLKVLEALAAGKAVVASRLAVEGIDARPGEQFLLAETDDDLVDALAALVGDSELRRAFAQRARAWAEQNLGWEREATAFERLYETLAAARARQA